MAKAKTMELRFPGAGVARRLGLESEGSLRREVYPTPWAVNVRLEDALSSRLRGGSWTPISAGARDSTTVYRDRLLQLDGAVIEVSRQGNQADFALSSSPRDLQRPTVLQLSEAGETGSDVVSLIPHKDKFLLASTADELWVLQGDPLTGGPRNVSREVGTIDADAWCKNHDLVYLLSSHGLYSVAADGSGLEPVSEDKVPEELTGVVDSSCTLTYNHADRGVYIHLPGADVSWFYDVARDQFWPFDGDASTSHVLIGPLRLAGPNRFGLIHTLHGVMAAGSATVTWRIVTGDTAEAAAVNGKAAVAAHLADESYAAYVEASGTWEPGRSLTSRPRVRAMWACIWLSASSAWAYESMVLESLDAGPWR